MSNVEVMNFNRPPNDAFAFGTELPGRERTCRCLGMFAQVSVEMRPEYHPGNSTDIEILHSINQSNRSFAPCGDCSRALFPVRQLRVGDRAPKHCWSKPRISVTVLNTRFKRMHYTWLDSRVL